MARSGIGFVVRKLIFESNKVLASMDKATRKNLSKFGFETRKDAKASIRKKRKPSLPGQPPRSVTGLLKRTIFYWVDASTSVVVGPIALPNTQGLATSALEHGGQSINKAGRSVFIAARPYIRPSFERTRVDIRRIWTETAK